MIFDNIHSRMDVFTRTFELRTQNGSQIQTIQAPRMMLEQQFISLAEDISHMKDPAMIKISRIVPMYDKIDKCWVNREHSIELKNNHYVNMEKK